MIEQQSVLGSQTSNIMLWDQGSWETAGETEYFLMQKDIHKCSFFLERWGQHIYFILVLLQYTFMP